MIYASRQGQRTYLVTEIVGNKRIMELDLHSVGYGFNLGSTNCISTFELGHNINFFRFV